jgi:hypothetical protein
MQRRKPNEMQTLPPPPYQKPRHLKRSSGFIAELTPEKLTAYGDRLEQAEADLPAIRTRISALYHAMIEDGWTPPGAVCAPLDNLNRGLSAWLAAERSKYVRETLEDAEADLATWQQMTPAQRDQRLADFERKNVEAAERRKAEAVLKQRHAEFYAAMKQLNVSPPRWLDNQIANWSLA